MEAVFIFVVMFISIISFFFPFLFIGSIIAAIVKKPKSINDYRFYMPSQNNYPKKDTTKYSFEVTPEELQSINVFNVDNFKNTLYDLLSKFLYYYQEKDLENLYAVCSKHFFKEKQKEVKKFASQKLKCVQQVQSLRSTKIYDLQVNHNEQMVCCLFTLSYCYYVEEPAGHIIFGNKFSVQTDTFEVIYKKNSSKSKSNTNCPNCGAPAMPYDVKCDYCHAFINNDSDWKINSFIKLPNDTGINTNYYNMANNMYIHSNTSSNNIKTYRSFDSFNK